MIKSFCSKGLLLLAVTFFVAGCGEKKVDPVIRCFPVTTSVVESQSGSNWSSVGTFTYNGDKLISGSFTSTSSSGTSTSTSAYTYDPNGNMIKEETETYYTSYTYNGTNQLMRVERFNKPSNTLDFRDDYEYNASGQLVKKQYFVISSAGMATKSSYYAYEYAGASDKNVLRSKYFNVQNVLQSTTDYEYDNKKTPFADLGVNLADRSVNNTTKETTRNSSGAVTSTTISTYQYDEKGYPTQEIRTSNNVGSSTITITITYTYNCK
jgi:hypothetical protein